MRVIVLGCGPSTGVPLITGRWGQCNPYNLRNRRRRASILIQKEGKNILIDAGPDLREQLLATGNITHLDAVILTHHHADHVRGLDELKMLSRHHLIPLYGHEETLKIIETGYPYAFQQWDKFSPFLKLVPFTDSTIVIDDIEIKVFPQHHGNIMSWGIRIDDFAYSTDFNILPEESKKSLKHLSCWMVDCLRFEPHKSHSWLDNTLKLIEEIKPQHSLLTHMNEELDYDQLLKLLPPAVKPAYDGMIIDFSGAEINICDIA